VFSDKNKKQGGKRRREKETRGGVGMKIILQMEGRKGEKRRSETKRGKEGRTMDGLETNWRLESTTRADQKEKDGNGGHSSIYTRTPLTKLLAGCCCCAYL
jgi:hypothetical protein